MRVQIQLSAKMLWQNILQLQNLRISFGQRVAILRDTSGFQFQLQKWKKYKKFIHLLLLLYSEKKIVMITELNKIIPSKDGPKKSALWIQLTGISFYELISANMFGQNAILRQATRKEEVCSDLNNLSDITVKYCLPIQIHSDKMTQWLFMVSKIWLIID